MATNRRVMPVPAAAVWAVLADGFSYASWVVGTRLIRDVDDTFPAVGSRLHYTVGHGLLRHEGHTTVFDADPGSALVLQVRAWPLVAVHVELSLEPLTASSTEVTMVEYPSHGLGALVHNRGFDAVIALRNVETLRRLAAAAKAPNSVARQR